MPTYAPVILVAAWIVWMIPFLLVQRKAKAARQTPPRTDPRARWGILIQGVAYWILWIGAFWTRPVGVWRLSFSLIFFLLGCGLSWSSVRRLGRQWRIDAGLNTDHELIRSGAYAIVRHPIYASMLCMLLGSGFMVTPWTRLGVAVVISVIGTEIRVRIEDSLLRSRFGDTFLTYQRSVPAYIPFIR